MPPVNVMSFGKPATVPSRKRLKLSVPPLVSNVSAPDVLRRLRSFTAPAAEKVTVPVSLLAKIATSADVGTAGFQFAGALKSPPPVAIHETLAPSAICPIAAIPTADKTVRRRHTFEKRFCFCIISSECKGTW